MSRGRMTRQPDVGRMSRAVQRPGIDPRMWCAICAVVSYHVDTDEGAPFADVAVLHQSPPLVVTVRVAPFYAGPGYGFYASYDVDDEVVVCFPNGNYDHGGYILGKAWSPSDPMPDVAKDNKSDVCLVVKKDVTMRIVAQGQGNIVIQADEGKVLLGGEDGTHPIARKGDRVDMGTWFFTPGSGGAQLQYKGPGDASLTTISPPPTGTQINGTSSIPGKPQGGEINTGSGDVEST